MRSLSQATCQAKSRTFNRKSPLARRFSFPRPWRPVCLVPAPHPQPGPADHGRHGVPEYYESGRYGHGRLPGRRGAGRSRAGRVYHLYLRRVHHRSVNRRAGHLGALAGGGAARRDCRAPERRSVAGAGAGDSAVGVADLCRSELLSAPQPGRCGRQSGYRLPPGPAGRPDRHGHEFCVPRLLERGQSVGDLYAHDHSDECDQHFSELGVDIRQPGGAGAGCARGRDRDHSRAVNRLAGLSADRLPACPGRRLSGPAAGPGNPVDADPPVGSGRRPAHLLCPGHDPVLLDSGYDRHGRAGGRPRAVESAVVLDAADQRFWPGSRLAGRPGPGGGCG